MFVDAFNQADVEALSLLYEEDAINHLEDGQWAITEWRDPLRLRGCGFFQVMNDKIVFNAAIGISYHS